MNEIPKRLYTYLVTFTGIGIFVYTAQDTLALGISDRFKVVLQNTYCFHAVFSCVTCIVFKLMSKHPKWSVQLGFIYLAVIAFKILLYTILFYNPLFSENALTRTESALLLLPIFVFLILEGYFIAKILNTIKVEA